MERIRDNSFFLAICCALIASFSVVSNASDTITTKQSLRDNQTLVSSGQKFVLGFFRPGNSGDRYLGIWYKNIPDETVVWVANRDHPLQNSQGYLTLGNDGRLLLLNESGGILWSSNTSITAKSPSALLLDTGNFVVKDEGEEETSENYLWQSFDYPAHTLLPGMKLGWNLRTGLNRHLRSWRSQDDPSPGDYTCSVDPRALPELVLRKGSTTVFRSGPWYGEQFSGDPALEANPVFKPIFVSTADELYYAYQITANVTSRFVLGQDGSVQHFSWNDERLSWNLLFTVQEDRCDTYGLCGSYGSCSVEGTVNCRCLRGFRPRLPKNWELLDWSDGCVRDDPQVCKSGEGFIKLTGMKLPDASQFSVNVSKNREDCGAECLKNCSCVAYAKLDIGGTGNGCVTWFGELIDTREVAKNGQDLYVRVAASELEPNADQSKGKKHMMVAVAVPVALTIILLALTAWFFSWKRKNRAREPDNQMSIGGGINEEDDPELPLLELATIEAATNNFSTTKKIGEGGFGPVYKGELPSGEEIAVKILREDSGQGLQEFKNEVIMVSELQHRNLVKLLGCCIRGEERMLVYEHMPNRSLDSWIFDEGRRSSLKWPKRLDIIIGVARGLLYLHRDSRLRVIHRDLTASNILLDRDMNPKISDFGMARIFAGDQTKARTTRIIGTYGYMSPEYAIDGQFSLKSDVFSFGVILLEILSGKQNRGFFHPDHNLNLIGHAWKLWNEGKALEVMDVILGNQFPASEALRCIQVGLLCVQQHPEERPTMSSVLLMLDNESALLAQPRRPGFYEERWLPETDSSSGGRMNCVSNEISMTLLGGR